MASHPPASTQCTTQESRFEDKREREFYRYYQPIRELTKSGPPLCDLSDDEAIKAHRPFSSPDRALTAFCQLGALRLQTRRAMLFFFDSNYAYVLAEATRTLSLQDDSVHGTEDDLWLGHTMIPRGHSVCEATVMLPANQGSNKTDSSSDVVHIVNDLSGDTRFCDRPFVTGGPRARFYAGVPITTPKGINIGAYCVLDDKPRQGLDEDGIGFLRDMAATIMTHLEMVRAKAEHKIGTQMIAGLGAFIDGASGFRDWAAQNNDFGLDGELNLSHPLGVQSKTSNASVIAQTAVQAGEVIEEAKKQSTFSLAPKQQRSRGSTISTNTPTSLRQSMSPADVDTTALNEQKTFERAANIVREAMSIDGVMFVDAAIGTFRGLVDTHETVSATEQSSDYHGSAAEATTGTEGEEKIIQQPDENDKTPKRCHILASSFLEQGTTNVGGHCISGNNREEMTEKFLRTLLRRYPRGKIWSFNEHGDASSEDESSEYYTDSDGCKCLDGAATPNSQGRSPSCHRRRKKHRVDDSKEILRLFPGIRSVGLVGMWDYSKQRWYAASIFWSYSPMRLFSQESEVKYMTAFTDVIMAELHRLEAQKSDRAKSDFISTISHELRSPLHGILGSVECLQEQEMDAFSAGFVSQVEVCGKLLLELIDHLLDFSKINHQTKARKHLKSQKIARAKGARLGGHLALDSDVSLDQITEEVVETAVYSFSCSRDAEMILARKVAVVLDIDRPAHSDWRCRVALGAWKRVCINLVSNALKYTNVGHVRVSLKASPIPDKKKRFNVTFSVSDTGRGMSREFLENHLFRAFSQEDSLVEGAGLGMNLVAKITRSFDGRIEVQSEKGVGSTFSVTIPLEHSRTGHAISETPAQTIENAVRGVSIGVIEDGTTPLTSHGNMPDETARTVLQLNLHKTLAQIGVKATSCTWAGNHGADLYLVTEGELNQNLKRMQDMGHADQLMSPSALSNKPFIVLCESTLSARRIRVPSLGNIATGYIELIAQPAGPDRLTKAIASCVRNKTLVKSVQAMDGAVQDFSSSITKSVSAVNMNSLPSRPRKDTGSPADSDSGSHDAGHSEADAGDGDRSLVAKGDRGLASDFRFPRVPTPSLTGIWPRISSGSTNKAEQTLKKFPGRKDDTGVSLLLVDDNPINLQLLVTYADKYGYRKMIATDGQQAVDAYKAACGEATETFQRPEIVRNDSGNDMEEPEQGVRPLSPPSRPQVILMDINMPVLDGFEATRQIRLFEKQKGVEAATVIALTGLGSASAQQEAFSSGVNLFLTKPVRLKELTKILDGIRRL